MISLYVDGRHVGPFVDIQNVLRDYTSKRIPVELRDDSGASLGRVVPNGVVGTYSHVEIARMMAADEVGPIPNEEIERRINEGGTSLAQFWAEIGVR